MTRPTLTWWQRLLVRVAPDRWLKSRPWCRAWIGGRWARRIATGTWHRVPCCPAEAGGLLRMLWGVPRADAEAHRERCACEVYEWPALRAGSER